MPVLAHAACVPVSQVRWEAALVLVCGNGSGCASCWDIHVVDFCGSGCHVNYPVKHI